MNWLEVTIYASKMGLEVLTGVLLQLGITGFVVQDPDDFEEFLKGWGTQWDYMDEEVEKLKDSKRSLTVYFPDNLQGRELFVELKNTLSQLKGADKDKSYGELTLEFGNVNEEDWADNWKKYFKPFEVGQRFLIKPSWEEVATETNRIILEIDPNSSFGTGQHYTTQLCIEALEEHVTKDSRILDMGCGSGILSIAAILLGGSYVTAVDIDENSVNIAGENFKKNQIPGEMFETYCGNVIQDEELAQKLLKSEYDIVVANIVADVIMMMKELLKKFVRPGGLLIASGIIGERAKEVEESLQASGFLIEHVSEKNDWVAITARCE